MQKFWQALVDLQKCGEIFFKEAIFSFKAATKYEGQNNCCNAGSLLFFAAAAEWNSKKDSALPILWGLLQALVSWAKRSS